MNIRVRPQSLRGITCLSAILLSACSVSEAPAPARTAACAPVVACPAGSQCVANNSPPVSSAAPAPLATPNVEPRPFELHGTEVRAMSSKLTGKDYELLIDVPPSFNKEPNRRYPVLFLLDGQWDFALLHALTGGLRYDRVMPEMIVVGISYGGKNPNYDDLRADDYVPTRAKHDDGPEIGGGAARFLSWLEIEVVPLVEREYRADPAHRILSGSSYGGLFTLYALFEKPDLFESYVAICPTAMWDQRYIFGREKDFRKSHPKLEKRLWLSSGSDEWPVYLKNELAFFEQVKSSHYAGLTLKIYQAAGERHSGLKPESYNRALRFVSEPFVTTDQTKGK